jgi:hypothetical protein
MRLGMSPCRCAGADSDAQRVAIHGRSPSSRAGAQAYSTSRSMPWLVPHRLAAVLVAARPLMVLRVCARPGECRFPWSGTREGSPGARWSSSSFAAGELFHVERGRSAGKGPPHRACQSRRVLCMTSVCRFWSDRGRLGLEAARGRPSSVMSVGGPQPVDAADGSGVPDSGVAAGPWSSS